MESITNESVDKKQQAQNFKNLKFDPLESSRNILFNKSNDPDLHFYNTNIQKPKYSLYIAQRTSRISRLR